MAEVPHPHNDENHPRDTPHHDVLIINQQGILHRVPVEKRLGHPNEGRYLAAPETAHFRESGHRKVFNIAHAHSSSAGPDGQGNNPSTASGPAFALLPIKPEPASSNWTCYLINAQRLNYRNPWTIEAWNDEPDDEETADGSAQAAETDAFELLIAGPRGDVYHVQKPAGQDLPAVKKVNLQNEQDVWGQLRNGCVVGTAEFYNQGEPRVVPLVNTTCLVLAAKGKP